MESAQAFSVDRYYELARQSGAEITTIGFSEQGRPIQVLRKGSGNLKVLFIARIHGNEPATTQALLEFLKENSFSGINLYGIFLANPDGAALYEKLWKENPAPYWTNNFNDARLNANGADINRDWLELSQKETQVIQKFIVSIRPDFAIDFHEYYWSDKGYPPKLPLDDDGGFMATMTDAPFFGADNYVKDISEQSMNYLIDKLEKEFAWKIKTRHFVGKNHTSYENPAFLGIYLALRGIPKLLVETWGVACSTFLLDKRISFHKKAMQYALEWIDQNHSRFSSKVEPLTSIEFKINKPDPERLKAFTSKLALHGLEYELRRDELVIVHCLPFETGFIKTIYYLTYGNN